MDQSLEHTLNNTLKFMAFKNNYNTVTSEHHQKPRSRSSKRKQKLGNTLKRYETYIEESEKRRSKKRKEEASVVPKQLT